MGNKNCLCLDRDKDKERLNTQLNFTSPAPLKRNPDIIESYMDERRYSQNQTCISIKFNKKIDAKEFSSRGQSTKERPYMNSFAHSADEPHFLSPQRSISGFQQQQSKYSLSASQNIQIFMLKYFELKNFLKSNRQYYIDQIFPNPFNQQEVMVIVRLLQQNDYHFDLEVVFKQFNCPIDQLTRLYYFLHQYLNQNDNQYIGYCYQKFDRNVVIDVIVRKMNKQLAKYTKIELQALDLYTTHQVEETVNDRSQDKMVCQGSIEITCDKVQQDLNIIIFSQKETSRASNNLTVLSLGLEQLGEKPINEGICQKIDQLCQSEDLQLVAFLPGLRKKQLFIVMQVMTL